MKINRNSWHFKLVNNYGGTLPNNLCTYFWQVVGLSILFLIAVILAVVTSPVWIPAVGIMYFIDWLNDLNLKKETKAKLWHTMAVAGIALGFLVFVGGLSYLLITPYEERSIFAFVFSSLLLSFIFTVVYILLLFKLLVDGLSSWYNSYECVQYEQSKVSPPPKEPNILLEWIKAKKNKVCPLIQYVND